MRIAIDLSAVRTVGPLVYSQGFLPALAQLLGPSDELTVFGPENIAHIASQIAGPRIRFFCRPELIRVPWRLCWQQLSLPRALFSLKTDVFFAPFDIGPWWGDCPMVVGIRNPFPVILAGGVMPLSWSEWATGRLHMAMVSRTCRRARLMIFPSQYAANAIGSKLPGLPGQRRVVHHGLDAEFRTDSERLTRERGQYILFASKFYVPKRAPLLLEAFAIWRARFHREDYKLIYCGEPPESAESQAVLRRAAELKVAESIEMRGIVSRAELRNLCLDAAEIVMPTVLETFGFPYIEAMAAQTPLVCADIEVARELCGEAAYYFRPDDAESLAHAMECPLTDDGERNAKLRWGAARAREFSWEREAAETLACLREAAAMQAPR